MLGTIAGFVAKMEQFIYFFMLGMYNVSNPLSYYGRYACLGYSAMKQAVVPRLGSTNVHIHVSISAEMLRAMVAFKCDAPLPWCPNFQGIHCTL